MERFEKIDPRDFAQLVDTLSPTQIMGMRVGYLDGIEYIEFNGVKYIEEAYVKEDN